MKQPTSSLLIITEDSPKSYSPSGERIRHLALASSSIFSSVVILALKAEKQKKTVKKHGFPVSLCEINFSRAVLFPLSAFFDPVKMLMFLVHGLILCRRIEPSHLLISMPPLETGVSAWFISKLHRSKLVIDIRDDWESAANNQLKQYFPAKLIKLLLVIANRIYASAFMVLAVNQTIAHTIQKRVDTAKILLVPNGAETSVFKPESSDVRTKRRLDYTLPLDKIILVYCGSGVNPYYRLDLVLWSIKTLPKDTVKNLFFVFYVYNGLSKLDKLRRQLKIPEEVVQIRSPLPRSKLAKVLSACDVGLVPFDAKQYLLCAISTKLYEYLSSGLYVICSGPKGGELDSFFLANPPLGFFTVPSVSGFAFVFQQIVERTEVLYNNGFRESQHAFIREHYDRKHIMGQAVRVIQASS